MRAAQSETGQGARRLANRWIGRLEPAQQTFDLQEGLIGSAERFATEARISLLVAFMQSLHSISPR